MDWKSVALAAGQEKIEVLRGGHGPGLLLMHELSGPTSSCLALGERLIEAGFFVELPLLFGRAGEPLSGRALFLNSLQVCIRREFSLLSGKQSSPITDWLRARCRSLHEECGGRGVGALGMCLTGNFALSLALDPSVLAPVLSQPSLPLALTPRLRGELHLPPEDLQTLRARGCPVLGLRFTGDRMCPPERFDALRAALPGQFQGIEIDSSLGNSHGISPSAHSVLTEELMDQEGHPTREALERVISFFVDQLRGDDVWP